ncbi:hypothetical protein LguiA_029555 [Lonicera macranthoides]
MAMSRAHPLSALHLQRPENEEDIAFMSVTSLLQAYVSSTKFDDGLCFPFFFLLFFFSFYFSLTLDTDL